MTDEPITPQVLIQDDEDAPQKESHRATAEEAYTAGYHWRGQLLQPFSIMRDRLLEKLQALDAPLPRELRNARPEFVLYDAEKVLWLCSQSPAELQALMPFPLRMLEASQMWGNANIAEGEGMEAISLANRIVTDAEATRAVERPGRGNANSAREGN